MLFLFHLMIYIYSLYIYTIIHDVLAVLRIVMILQRNYGLSHKCLLLRLKSIIVYRSVPNPFLESDESLCCARIALVLEDVDRNGRCWHLPLIDVCKKAFTERV